MRRWIVKAWFPLALFTILALPLLTGAGGPHPSLAGIDGPRLHRYASGYRLPAEFENQEGLLLAGSGLVSDFPDLLGDLVGALHRELPLFVLVNDDTMREEAEAILRDRGLAFADVRFLQVRHDTPWVRDYGPLVVRDSLGAPVLVDALYDVEDRQGDEAAPLGVARLLGLPVVQSGLVVEGGNLLSNGAGLFIATTQLPEQNRKFGIDREQVRAGLRHYYGATEVILLEPLHGEPTGHVDTFATFVARNVVVVAAADPARDPVNAAILDRNARRLGEARYLGRPLKVVRVRTPHHEDGVWRTYTNVIFANGVVLVPVYPGMDPGYRREAVKVFRACLPGREVLEIDARAIMQWDGALHCISMNLGPAGS